MHRTTARNLAILLALFVALYVPVLGWMIDRWQATDTYYSHGFLIPFISIFIIWYKRKKLERMAIEPSAAGWLMLAGGIGLFLISSFWRLYSPAGFSMIPVLAGLILLFLGKQFLRALLFPLLFLGFMIPLPMILTAQLSFRLKIIAAQLAVAVVNELGVRAIREGSIIRTAHAYLVVEDPCSGIRSLIALTALGALMAFFSGKSKRSKWIIFASSIPIAIITNAIRIVVLTMISEIYGPQHITDFLHSLMGIVVLVLSLLGLRLIARILR